VFVAKNPESGSEGVYSHVFLTAKKEQVRWSFNKSKQI
jgi:hypothetical protein